MIGWTSITGLIPLFRGSDDIEVDGPSLALQSRWTSAVLVVSATLLTCYMVFGSPIACTNQNELDEKYVLSLCWSVSTQTNLQMGNESNSAPYPYLGNPYAVAKENVVVHSYYLWSPLVLIILALVAKLPQLVWRAWEGHLIRSLVIEDRHKITLSKDPEAREYIENVGRYFSTETGSRRHLMYGYGYLICVLLNLVVVFIIIMILHFFINHQFFDLGIKVLKYQLSHEGHELDPLVRLFPSVTRCVLRQVGSSGSLKKMEELCVLMMNIVNRQVFLALWIWLVVVTFILLVMFIYRILTVFFACLRFNSLRRATCWKEDQLEVLQKIVDMMTFGDWLLVYKLVKHFEPKFGRTILTQIISDLSTASRKREIEDPHWIFTSQQ